MTSTGVRSALACVLALAQLMMPFAHGRADGAPPGWADICASDGLRRAPTGGAPASSGHHEDHCALCRVSGSMPGLAASIPASLAAQAEEEEPAIAIADFFGRLVTHDAQARAPPLGC